MDHRIPQTELTTGLRLYVRNGWARQPVTVLNVTAERIVVRNAAGLREEYLRDGREVFWAMEGLDAGSTSYFNLN